jgi:hypothetical protein
MSMVTGLTWTRFPKFSSTMPIQHCPTCNKSFSNRTRLLQHVGHPLSRCHGVEGLVKFPYTDAAPSSQLAQLDAVMDEPALYPPDFHTNPTEGSIGGVQGSISAAQSGKPALCIERYPGAAKTISGGKTFMDIFDMDEHSKDRQDNLYYPFASREEWQTASFLLRSGLSMEYIDEFLSLDLVSVPACPRCKQRSDCWLCRSRDCSCHFKLRKNCVAAPKFFHLAPSGSAPPGPKGLAIQRRQRSSSFTVIQLTVCSLLCTPRWPKITLTLHHYAFSKMLRCSCVSIPSG